MQKLNIEWEKLFLNLFGYVATGPDNGGRWIIQDENGNVIGFIQLKMDISSIKELGLQNSLGYYMELESETIKMVNFRNLLEEELLEDDRYNLLWMYLLRNNYRFDIKRENGIDHVEWNLCACGPKFSLVSEIYEGENRKKSTLIDFKMNKDDSITELKLVIEDLQTIYEFVGCEYCKKVLDYCIKRSQKDNDTSSNKEYMVELEVYGEGACYNRPEMPRLMNADTVFIREYWQKDSDSEINWTEKEVQGTLDEVVMNTPIFVDTFARFRNLLNLLLPIKGDFLSILKNMGIDYNYKEGVNSPMFDLLLMEVPKKAKEKVLEN